MSAVLQESKDCDCIFDIRPNGEKSYSSVHNICDQCLHEGRTLAGEHGIKIRKASERAIVPAQHDPVLKLFREMESELGRLSKLLNEARAEYLITTK